jgi:hypothetical protein
MTYTVYHPPMIYNLWPEDGLKQRPKHVVRLNKTTKTSCKMNDEISLKFSSRGSVQAFRTQARGFKPGQSRRIFKGKEKSSACQIFEFRKRRGISWLVELCLSPPQKKISLLHGVNYYSYEIYNALIKNSLLYGSETWRLTKNIKRRVKATEMDALRRSSRISRK